MSSDAPTRYWPLRVKAAYLWILGEKQKDIADEVNRAPSTIRRWKDHESWSQAVEEAEGRWLTEVMRESRQTVLEAVRTEKNEDGQITRFGDPQLAFEIIQRRDERVKPAEQRVSIDADVTTDTADARERLARQLGGGSAAGAENGASPAGTHRNGGSGS